MLSLLKEDLKPGAFLLQYPAEVISKEEATLREEAYANDGNGCFLYYLDNPKSIRPDCTNIVVIILIINFEG